MKPDASRMSNSVYRTLSALERRRLEDAKRRGDRPPDPDSPYLETDQAARMLGCAPTYIGYLCRSGQLGYLIKQYRHGVFVRRVRLIPKSELVEYMKRKYVVRGASALATLKPSPAEREKVAKSPIP